METVAAPTVHLDLTILNIYYVPCQCGKCTVPTYGPENDYFLTFHVPPMTELFWSLTRAVFPCISCSLLPLAA
jgi:hypothetical protein